MYKIIGADQKEYGPVTADQLRQWLAEGRVNPQTQVLPEGATEWTTLGALPEFATASSAAPPAMPSFPAPASAAAALVAGPAIGLIVTAILSVLLLIASLIFKLAGASFLASNQMPNEAWTRVLYGPIGMVSNIIGIVMSCVVLLGAIKMKKLENYGLAMAASIIAMIPCNFPCCFIGLPIGIWAVVVLSKPEVKSAFR